MKARLGIQESRKVYYVERNIIKKGSHIQTTIHCPLSNRKTTVNNIRMETLSDFK